MRYLVNTDWVIDALAARADALETLRELSSEGIAISVISLGEIYEGAFDQSDTDEKLARYRTFLDGYPVILLSDPIMLRFARERSRLRRLGGIVPDLDLLIGVTAVEFELRVLTRNRRHFERVEGIDIFERS